VGHPLADVVHGRARSPVHGDHEVIGEDEMDLISGRLIGRGPVDHHVGEVVVVLELGALAEVLGIVHGQVVDAKHGEQHVVGVVVHAVEVEPEELTGRQTLFDGLASGRGGRSSEGQGSVHLPILVPESRADRDGPGGPG